MLSPWHLLELVEHSQALRIVKAPKSIAQSGLRTTEIGFKSINLAVITWSGNVAENKRDAKTES